MINYGEPSQPKLEMELYKFIIVLHTDVLFHCCCTAQGAKASRRQSLWLAFWE